MISACFEIIYLLIEKETTNISYNIFCTSLRLAIKLDIVNHVTQLCSKNSICKISHEQKAISCIVTKTFFGI